MSPQPETPCTPDPAADPMEATPSGATVGAHLMRESILADPPTALYATTPTTQRTHNFTKENQTWSMPS
jgi:hypothetical protein